MRSAELLRICRDLPALNLSRFAGGESRREWDWSAIPGLSEYCFTRVEEQFEGVRFDLSTFSLYFIHSNSILHAIFCTEMPLHSVFEEVLLMILDVLQLVFT